MKINLTTRQLLGLIIFGLQKGNHEATLKLVQECYDTLASDKEVEVDRDADPPRPSFPRYTAYNASCRRF